MTTLAVEGKYKIVASSRCGRGRMQNAAYVERQLWSNALWTSYDLLKQDYGS